MSIIRYLPVTVEPTASRGPLCNHSLCELPNGSKHWIATSELLTDLHLPRVTARTCGRVHVEMQSKPGRCSSLTITAPNGPLTLLSDQETIELQKALNGRYPVTVNVS